MPAPEPADAADDVGAVADRLYALPLAEFTAERNAVARAARARKDRGLAAEVAALPKPSASAWLVNELSREGRDDLARLLELGTALRAAQDGADGRRLRQLGTTRRELLAEVTARTVERVQRTGAGPSPAVLEEFQQTLQAALISGAAAAAVRSGCLVRALRADGLDPVDLSDAVALPDRLPQWDPAAAVPAPAPAQQDAAAGAPAESRALVDARRRVEETAERAAALRRQAQDRADRARDAEARLEERTRAVDALQARIDELHAQARAAEQAVEAARSALARSHAGASEAEAAADAASAEAEDAATRLRRLQPR